MPVNALGVRRSDIQLLALRAQEFPLGIGLLFPSILNAIAAGMKEFVLTPVCFQTGNTNFWCIPTLLKFHLLLSMTPINGNLSRTRESHIGAAGRNADSLKMRPRLVITLPEIELLIDVLDGVLAAG